MRFPRADRIRRGSLLALAPWLLLAARLPAWQGFNEVQPAGGQRLGTGAAQATDQRAQPAEAPRELTPPTAKRVPKAISHDTSGSAYVEDVPAAANPTPTPADAGPKLAGLRSIAQAAAQPQVRRITTIGAAKLSGLQAGVSKLIDVQRVWGEPLSTQSFEGHVEYTYHMEPFQRITVTLVKDTVTSLTVHLQDKFPVEGVTRQLELTDVEPVLVTNDEGEVLGQAFPERGVLFSFEPGQKEHLVSQVLLRPIEFQPFALRAEANLQSKYEGSLRDLQTALQINPRYARGHWLRSQLLAAVGRFEAAVASIDTALKLDEANAEYRLTRADILVRQGDQARGITETKNVLGQTGLTPLLRGRALVQLAAQLAAPPQREYHAAVERRQEAIKLLEPLTEDRLAGVRRAAKDLLIDAQLAIAHDIAWGAWNRKTQVVPKWLQEAESVAQEAIASGDGDQSLTFRVGQQALSALAALKGEVDPASWVAATQKSGHALIDATEDPLTRQQRQWALGLALYDAVQIHHARGQAAPALECGREAVVLIELATHEQRKTELQSYLLGRLYFRVGAVHAVLAGEHSTAIEWFEKAMPPLVEGGTSQPLESGKQGEAFISMAISYWETGEHQKALQLTGVGLELMQRAVRTGQMSEAALLVAYANLASMHRHLGDEQNAKKYAELASKSQPVRK